MIRFIGDVHGKFPEYRDLLADPDVHESRQVGDMGIGFESMMNDGLECPAGGRHMFIRGNHDNPAKCRTTEGYISSGTIEHHEIGRIMYIGGADSPDKAMRREGVSWWRDEEHTIRAFNGFIEKAEAYRPNIIVTHDCPQVIAYALFGLSESSRTRQAFNALWEAHRPRLWVFGHHHQSITLRRGGTMFRCLAELETFDVAGVGRNMRRSNRLTKAQEAAIMDVA